MNGVTRDIMTLLSVPYIEAWEIHRELMETGVDFSECSMEELRTHASHARATLINRAKRTT